ncbi:MAG: hypothetical protein WC732_08780 [Candidatus Omnitrophota bacterium]
MRRIKTITDVNDVHGQIVEYETSVRNWHQLVDLGHGPACYGIAISTVEVGGRLGGQPGAIDFAGVKFGETGSGRGCSIDIQQLSREMIRVRQIDAGERTKLREYIAVGKVGVSGLSRDAALRHVDGTAAPCERFGMRPIAFWTDAREFAGKLVAYSCTIKLSATEYGRGADNRPLYFGRVDPYPVSWSDFMYSHWGYGIVAVINTRDGHGNRAMCASELDHADLAMRLANPTEVEMLRRLVVAERTAVFTYRDLDHAKEYLGEPPCKKQCP